MPPPPSSLLSAATLSFIGFPCKAFLNLTTQGYHVHGSQHLLKALAQRNDAIDVAEAGDADGVVEIDGEKPFRRGIITVCNHNSVVDDPMMWSFLPTSNFFPLASPQTTCLNTRWTLGASDIMFTSAPTAKFFTAGQVIETVRGGGIYQKAVDTAIQRVEEGAWVHIFPEGKVNQKFSHPAGGLLRFKWGVGRIIMDSRVMPEIVPIWISGFDQIMDEHRGFPRFVPRGGAKVSVTIGESIRPQVEAVVNAHRAQGAKPSGPTHVDGDAAAHDADRETRIQITQMLQDAVQALGEKVETAEGRFERGEWSQSRARVEEPVEEKAKA
ncbi:Lyso-phosphatidylcholine acyltransferase [Vanrija albida]|uniref:Tafazzin family protein n=1 Tax=Vanrija albida TaxID=181172 RepID=A0ABR3Q5F7_9TREE